MRIHFIEPIHRRLCLWLLTHLIVITTALGQLSPGLHSIDTPTDPRGIAMAESFVAVHSSSSMMYNPAGIARLRGASFSFARRNLDHYEFTSTYKYIAYSGTVETPYFNAGLYYSRFMQGDFVVATNNSPQDIGKVALSDYILGLAVARNLTGGLDAGVTLKTFRTGTDVVSGNPPTFSSNTPLLFDLGLIYSTAKGMAENSGNFVFSAGASLQNFGADVKEASSGLSGSQSIYKPPRYLRCGLAISTAVSPRTEGALVPFGLLISGEYRNFLNGHDESERSFWGFGGEVTLFEIVAGRIGAYVQPFRSIYGDQDEPSFRFGLGATLPLARLGMDTPLVFTFDYSIIPLNSRISFLPLDNSTLHAFSIGVRYDNQFFEKYD